MKDSRIDSLREKLLEGIGVPEKSEFKIDAFQTEAIEALSEGYDTLVVAPTGAGKTFIALESIRQTIKRGGRAVYTAPLKALSNSKYSEFSATLEPESSVGLLTGDRKIDGDADLVVATTEIYRNELYAGADSFSLVVFDEFHYLADSWRGHVWEESIILSPQDSTLLMLSASVSNAEEVAAWIKSIRYKEVKIVEVPERPVELRLGFLHPRSGLMPLHSSKGEVLSEVKQLYLNNDKQNKGPRSRRNRKYSGGNGRKK